jgi:hypothetical protein
MLHACTASLILWEIFFLHSAKFRKFGGTKHGLSLSAENLPLHWTKTPVRQLFFSHLDLKDSLSGVFLFFLSCSFEISCLKTEQAWSGGGGLTANDGILSTSSIRPS